MKRVMRAKRETGSSYDLDSTGMARSASSTQGIAAVDGYVVAHCARPVNIAEPVDMEGSGEKCSTHDL